MDVELEKPSPLFYFDRSHWNVCFCNDISLIFIVCANIWFIGYRVLKLQAVHRHLSFQSCWNKVQGVVWFSSDFLRVKQGLIWSPGPRVDRREGGSWTSKDRSVLSVTTLWPTPTAASLSPTDAPEGMTRKLRFLPVTAFLLQSPSSLHLRCTCITHGGLNCNTQNPTTVMASDRSSPETATRPKVLH